MASSPLPIHTQKPNTTATSTNTNANTASASTLSMTPKEEPQEEEEEGRKTTPTPRLKKTTATESAHTTTSKTTTAAATATLASLPKQQHSKHIIIDEEQNQQQQIPSHMIIPLTKTSSIDSDTQSVMTTFSVSNTNSLSRILNRLRGGEPLDSNKDFWMPDEQCKECNNCNAPFNLFRRKHHCRTCGRIFCSKCLSNSIHTSHSLRVCNDCYSKFMEGYRADDTISLHDGYSYSSVVVDGSLSSSLQPQQQQLQKSSFLIPTSGDDDSSDEELEFDRSTNSFDMQRPLDIHFSQSTSSHHTASDSDMGLKKLLTNTFLRTTPRSRTSTMNSLGIDTSVATLEGPRQQQQQQQQMNSPMPFRRNSFLVTPVHHEAGNSNHLTHLQQQHMLIQHHHQQQPQQPQGDCYDGGSHGNGSNSNGGGEDDDLRRNPRNLLNFWGNGERPASGVFNNFSYEDYHVDSPVPKPIMSTSTSTINKTSSWLMRPSNEHRSNSIMRRRLSLTETNSSGFSGGNTSSGSSSNGGGGGSGNNSNLNSGSSTSSTRHIRVRTKSLMRNTPITMSSTDHHSDNSSTGGYESPASTSNRNSFCQPLTPSTSTPTTHTTTLTTNTKSATTNNNHPPDLDQLRAQILSVSASTSHPVTVATHHQWDSSFIYLMRNIITHLLKEGGLPLEDWEQVMMKLLLVIADQVQPHIRIRDTFNLNHYVKIKKVPGGLPKDSFSVSGVVLSKSVAHKHMMRKIKNPSILILNFDVDGFGGGGGGGGGGGNSSSNSGGGGGASSSNAPYNNTASSAASIAGFSDTNAPRQEYLKFDRLLAWEKEHMNSLVSEIIGLKPHIVLIASHAPRTIIERLNQANIIVAYNIKKQKLDAIARCADATVFNYKNELWNAKTMMPGKCGLFEPLTVMHEYLPNRRKTFLMFHACPKERGATIVLRGGSIKTLATVKYIMNFMVKVVNNINLEAQLRKNFIELRRYIQPANMYGDYYNSHAAAIGFDEEGMLEMGDDDDDSSTLHQHPIRSTAGGRSTTASSYHQEGSSSEPVTMDTQSVSALSVAESQITVNTVDINAAKKKSQQQYQQATVIVEDDDVCLTAINLVLKKYQTTTLSISPGVTLPVPHILLKLRESQKKLIGLIRERLGVHITGNILADNSSIAASPTSPQPTATAADPEKQALNNSKPIIPPIPTDLMLMHDYLKAFDAYLDHDLEYRHYQDLHLQCWLLFKRYIGDIHLYLTPVHHQQIIVRRTTNPMDNHSFPCEKAMLDPYDYYNPMGDCTLGQYILNSIKDAYTKCSSKMCGGPMIFHDRTYSHGNAQIKVQVFLEDDNGGEDELVEEKIDISRDEYLRRIPILICTHCNFCNVTHNWKPMSDLLQRYSFGKFLELLFYQSESIPLYDHADQAAHTGGYFGEEEDGDGSGLGCPHGFYRDHTISFRYQNLSVNFTHAMVQVVEVNPPPLHLRFSSKQQMALKDASLDSTRSKIAKFFDSIIERNKAFSYDIVQPNMVDLCKEYLQELSQEALKNKKNLLQKLQMEYATSAPTDTLQLNNVLADLQNHAVTWDLKYIDFARRFVRPERELRRLTTNHLRKMFPAESLYNSGGSSSNTPVVSNLNLRTKRAIEAADLPLLDVGLDQEACMVPYGVSGSVAASSLEDYEAANFSVKDQPGLGESPTESYPWYDELKRFDQMFMQDDPASQNDTTAGNSYSGLQTSNGNKEERHKLKKKYSTDSYQDGKQPPSPQKMSGIDDVDEDARDLDPSVARRLSLELMKDAPKKKKEAEDKILKEQQEKLQQQKDREKRKNYLQDSRILESSQTADTPPSATTPPSTPMTDSFTVVTKPLIQDSSQSRLIRQAAALPILSSTAYKRLAGLLPDPMVGKSKSSPSPGNYLPIQQQKATPIQRLLDKSAQKNKNRKSQFYESSSNHFMENPAQQTPTQQQQQHQDAFPFPATQTTAAATAAEGPTPQKPAFYRGSPYTAKMPERSSIAYRYGFMSGLNNNNNSKMPMAERRLGATNITHPVSSALAATQAAQAAQRAAAAAAAAAAATSASASKASSSTTAAKEAHMQDISIARPRSRTMAIVGGSSSNLLQQPSSSRLRVGGRIPVPTSATHLLQYPGANPVSSSVCVSANSNSKGSSSNHKFSYSNSSTSHLPVPIASPHHPNNQYTRHHRNLSDGKITTRTIRQRLPSKASLEPYTKIKEMTGDDDDDDDMDIDRSSVSSLSSSSSSSSAVSFNDDGLRDDGTIPFMSDAGCQDGILVVSPTSDDEEQDEQDMGDDLIPFQHNTFSLTSTDEYDESLGREIVPSIIELEQFHREHQLQMSTNTLPFLSLECGMVVDKKNEGLELKGSTAMMEAAALLKSSSSVGIDWSTNTSGRNSIMKAITYVLAEKSISNLTPLEYPFSPNEHIFADSNILVREDEPSSIISYMLGSTFYNEKLQRKQELRMSKAEIFNTNNKEKPADATAESKPFFSEMFPETDEREKPWRFSFQGGSTSFSCKIYFAEQFDMLRKSCGCDEIFISSLARCTPWDTAGGKSGSIFLKTKDERFLIKQISKYEMDAFLGSANKYFLYMFNEVFDKGIPTVLCKIFGLYRIGFYNNVSGKSMKMDILVMENLFYDTSVKKVFDLKGSMRNRYAEKTGKDVEVFLDENLVEVISKNPLYMRVDTKCNLSDSLYNDTQFLLSLDVMDYSLLVGFDEDTNEIIVGIVDFIRTFTWDKKLESWVKESGMLGGGKKDPTIVSPRMYRKRFRSAIDLYFCMIPDFWTHILD
ncbi:unnamed protein product [Mucor fragilis]